MLLVIVAMKFHVIGKLVNVLMACVKLVLMGTLAVTNVNRVDMASIVKTNVGVVWMENHANQPMELVRVVLLDIFHHFVSTPAPTDFSVWDVSWNGKVQTNLTIPYDMKHIILFILYSIWPCQFEPIL